MKRRISLLLAIVMVLGSFASVFANDIENPGEFLKEKGVLTGRLDGDLALDEKMFRRDAVIMLSRLLGVEEEAKAFEEEGLPTWEDNEIEFYVPYLAWAQANEFFKGYSEEKFGPADNITAREYAILLLRALGYVEEAADFETVYEFADELDIFVKVYADKDDEITRGQMAQMTVNALYIEMKDSEETLADHLEIEMPEAEVGELKIVDVKADNLKEVVVEFDGEVDASTVTNANIFVKGNKGSSAVSEDGTYVVITMEGVLVNQRNYVLVAKDLVSVNGAELEAGEHPFKAFDRDLPELLEIIVTGPRNFDLVFSEPIKESGSLEVTTANAKLGNRLDLNGTNRVSVTVYTNLVDGQEYTINAVGFKDYAGYTNVVAAMSFVYEKDATPPVATVVKVEQDHVVVDFSKPVQGLKAANFYHTFNAWTSVGIYKDVAMKEVVDEKDVLTRVYVSFVDAANKDKSRPLAEGEVRFGIFGSAIKDNWGNALGSVEFTVTVVADKQAPEVALAVTAENQIRATFNKNVVFTNRNVEILDENEKTIAGLSWTVAGTGNQYTIDLSKNMPGTLLVVVIKNVKDTSVIENVMPTYTEVIEITDKTAPVIKNVYTNLVVNKDDANKYDVKQLIVLYSEEVESETALNASNYSLVKDKNVQILGGNPYFGVNNARVILPLTDAQAKLVDNGGVDLQVINVKDLAGNTIVPVLNAIDGSVSDATAEMEATATVTAKDTLVVKFEDELHNLNEKQFTILGGADFVMSINISGLATELEFKLTDKRDAFPVDAKPYSDIIEFNRIAKGGIINSHGIEVTNVDFTVVDRVAPAIVKAEWDEDVVIITLTEAVEHSVSIRTFNVAGAKVVDHHVDGNYIYLLLQEELTADTTLTQALPIYDLAGNSFKADKAIEVKAEKADEETPVDPEEPQLLKAIFHENDFLKNFGHVEVEVANLEGAAKYRVQFFLNDKDLGKIPEWSEMIDMGGNNYEDVLIYYLSEDALNIEIYAEDGETILHVFEDVVLDYAE